MSEIEGPRRRGRPVVRWNDRVKAYMYERSADKGWEFEQARSYSIERERWRLFCRGHPLCGTFPEGMRHQKL